VKMKRIPLIIIFIASIAVAGEMPLSPVCWPPNFAGITLGVTTDSEVQRLLGKGVFHKDEGDTGGRYFVDPKRTATLHVVNYTDAVVGEVTVQEGVVVKPTKVNAAISKWFNPQQRFGNWHVLHLGSTKDEVKKNLGEPVKGSTVDAWRYNSSCACEIEVFFTVYFKNDRIWKVVFSAPAG
jgi:hypothetical protein